MSSSHKEVLHLTLESLLPVDRARRLPCSAEAALLPSRVVSTNSRKSLPIHVELVIWRCNTSVELYFYFMTLNAQGEKKYRCG